MKKRIIRGAAFALAAIIGAFGLAACGSQPQGTGSQPQESGNAASAAETGNPESGPASADKADAGHADGPKDRQARRLNRRLARRLALDAPAPLPPIPVSAAGLQPRPGRARP